MGARELSVQINDDVVFLPENEAVGDSIFGTLAQVRVSAGKNLQAGDFAAFGERELRFAVGSNAKFSTFALESGDALSFAAKTNFAALDTFDVIEASENAVRPSLVRFEPMSYTNTMTLLGNAILFAN